jgi:hypothetical protein
MPAAGPWRYDVENAPRDGRWIVGYFDFIDGTNLYCGKWVIDEWRDAYNYRLSDSQLRAFATIAHLSARPEGLPTAKSLGEIGRKEWRKDGNDWRLDGSNYWLKHRRGLSYRVMFKDGAYTKNFMLILSDGKEFIEALEGLSEDAT